MVKTMRNALLSALLAFTFSGLHGNCCDPQPSCCDSLQGLEINAEFLWWQAKADGMFLGVREYGASFPFPQVNVRSHKYWEFGYSPGFRVGLSYQPCQWDDVAMYATFTHFRTTDTLRLNFDGVTSLNNDVQTLFTLFVTEATEVFDYTGSADFLFNRLDLGFAKYCIHYGCLSVVPKAAFTYVHTRQSVLEDIFSDGLDQIIVNSVKDSYSGYGATIGFDANYEFWSDSGLSVFSTLGLSGLWGPFNFTRSQTNTSSINDELASTLSTNQTHNVGRWMSDIQVGLQYQTCLCSCYQVAARVGWEFLYLANELNFLRAQDPTGMKVNGLTVGLAVGF